MGKTVGAVVHVVEVGRFERKWSVKLHLTFDREVVEKLQRLQCRGQIVWGCLVNPSSV